MSTNSLIMLLGASTAWAAVAPAYAPAPVYSSAAVTTSAAAGSSCANACVAKYRECQSDLNNTRAQCASDLAGCINYNPFNSEGTFVTPTACSASASATVYSSASSAPVYSAPPVYTTSAAKSDECSQSCIQKYNACRVAPGANMAQCASEISSCLGYLPFTDGSFVTPTACSSKAASTASNTAPAYTTVTAGGKTDACATKCNAEYDSCRVAPDANMAFCASQLAGCLNYNPFTGSFVTPTACSGSAPATAPASTAPAVYHPASSAPAVSHPVQSAPATYAPGHPAPAPTGPAPSGDACAATCIASYRSCQSDLNNTRAQCAAQLSACVGYTPYDNSGSFVTPTACSSSGSAKPTGAAGNGTNPAVSATYSAPAQYTGGASLMSGSFLAIAAGAVGLMI